METPSITQAEWEIMRVVWSYHSLTSREIIQTLSPILKWKEGTIKSLINRLVQKGYLKQNGEQKPMLYSASIDCNTVLQEDLSYLLSKSCNKDRAHHIAHLIETEILTIEDCKTLMHLLETKITKAPESVVCQCPKGQCTCQHHN